MLPKFLLSLHRYHEEHYSSQYSQLSQEQLKEWIQVKWCWHCARNNQAAQCTLKKPCSICQGRHLLTLHEVNLRPNRSFSELRRSFWILRGREADCEHQGACPECQRWRGQPSVLMMADLPEAHLRLYKPAFYSTGNNFKGAEQELRDILYKMVPALQQHLSHQRIQFCFNPPAAPHFGGVWEHVF